MQDRVSTYPGRVKLIPVAGQANTYDLTRADVPTQVGTPLNKANLLSDSVATALGVTTPSEAFAKLNDSISDVNTFYTSDLYLYLIGRHPYLNSGIYNDWNILV